MTKRKTDTDALAAAIEEFESALPGWWWKVCTCGVSRDADCGPDWSVLPRDHPHLDAFDGGFSVDLRDGTLADALRAVMKQALDAIAALT